MKLNQFEIQYLLNKEELKDNEKQYTLIEIIEKEYKKVDINNFLRIIGKKINYFLNYKKDEKIILKNKIVFDFKNNIIKIFGFKNALIENKENIKSIKFELGNKDNYIQIQLGKNKKENLLFLYNLFFLIADIKKNYKFFNYFFNSNKKAILVSQDYYKQTGMFYYNQTKHNNIIIQLFLLKNQNIKVLEKQT